MKRCYYCDKDMTFYQSEYYTVRKAIKPPRTPYRFIEIGVACEICGDCRTTTFDKWKDK